MYPGAEGGDGDDRIRIGDGEQAFAAGGDGDDTIRIGDGFEPFAQGNAGDDRIRVGNGYRAFVLGGAGDDHLTVGDGTVGFEETFHVRNELWGEAGSDVLIGGRAQDDYLLGGADHDVCDGRFGTDDVAVGCERIRNIERNLP